MKRFGMLSVLVVAMFICMAMFSECDGAVKDFNNPDYTITLNTSTAVMGGGYMPGRRYYLVVNESDTYIVRKTTWPVTGDVLPSLTAGRGIPINKDYGSWKDKYNIYQSSWYYIIEGGGAGNVAPFSATISYEERY